MLTLRGRSRRSVVAVLAAVAAVLATTAISASAHAADNSSTLTVVGTSDVFDSNLVQTVIKPGFEATHPGITLNYVSKGTGAAIQYAEAGTASALLVHAASLENQFVGSGYSTEQYGRALFWGDYVLLGPKSDPAKIATKDPHDIAGAFERIAALGATGKANFVSRGGTPGTTVQEHAIWALTSGVTTCTVSDVNGGGTSPSATTGACPLNISYPSWYHATGLTQGPNIVNADACNYSGGNCYVLTDRGTYNYLQSTGAAQNLTIVTRNNATKSRGGIPALVNSFHGYSVNPAKFSPDVAAGINQAAALQFLTWVTSPAAQAAIGQYLNGSNDPPFIPDAAPRITASTPTATVTGSKPVTISGTLSNVVPGTPPLAGKTVTLSGTDAAATPVTTQIATTTTDSLGKYTFKFTPTATRTYTVGTGAITQIEYPDLSPAFGDLLAPSSTTAGSVQVVAQPTIKKGTPKAGSLTLTGTLAPAPVDASAQLTLLASKDGGPEMAVGVIPVTAGQTSFSMKFPLAAGSYTYRLSYADSHYIALGYSAASTTTVP